MSLEWNWGGVNGGRASGSRRLKAAEGTTIVLESKHLVREAMPTVYS
jgi:hypothetical protein